jgi:hypothetical protein
VQAGDRVEQGAERVLDVVAQMAGGVDVLHQIDAV